ncbi:MAG: glycosyltransferase [Lachnospiraceae bacterium]|nr:glycosyltransferase [Lachnospiraceae bacterium]
METADKKPTVSVIIPVYNGEATLKRAVDSVLAQTFRDFELILVDDGSKDRSSAMCDEYAEQNPGIVRVMHKENGGLMRAWMDGMRMSAGSCLCFVDCDDWVDVRMLEKMSAALAYGEDGSVLPGQMICCSWYFEYSNKPAVAGKNNLPEGVYEGERLETEIKKELMGHETRRIPYSRCIKLISRELIENNVSFLNPDIRLAEDANTTIPAFLDADRIVVMQDPFYHYLFVEKSMVHTYSPGAYDDYVMLKKQLLKIVRQKGILTETDVYRECLFMFLYVIKNAIRRKDGPHAGKKAVERIQTLCGKEDYNTLISSFNGKIQDPANRLIAFVCDKPTAFRIRLIRLIFMIYDLRR